MNVLIIGGTGVLSTAVVSEALKRRIEITMINRGNRSIPSGVKHIKSDKNDYERIKNELGKARFTCVLDFLCYTDEETKNSFTFYSNYADQYFFISSCAVYDKTLPGLKNEKTPKPLKIWSYSVNKYKSEKLLISLASKSKCNYTIIRPCVTYDDTRIPYGIMPPYGFHWTLCARILAGKPVIRWNGGVNCTNMMRVEDFAVGVVGLIGNPNAYNEDFNICGDEMPSFNDVLEAISDILGKEIHVVDVSSEFYANEIPERKGEILGGRSIDAINSNAKIKLIVPEFSQTISLKEGIQMTLNAYQNANFQKGIDFRFDAEADRIIKKWCRKENLNWKHYHLCFINYLGEATLSSKLLYWKEFYKRTLILRLLHKLLKL